MFDLDFEDGLDVLKSNDSFGFENQNAGEVNCGRFLYCKNCKDGCEECDPILANRKKGKMIKRANKEIKTGQTMIQNLDVDEEKDKIEVDSEKDLKVHKVTFEAPAHQLPTLPNLKDDEKDGKKPVVTLGKMAVHAMKDNGGEPCTTWQIADFCHQKYEFFWSEFRKWSNCDLSEEFGCSI